VRARIQSGVGAEALPDDTLQKAEHVDLIQFGLIPEFVGRFPIMCSLQVNHTRRRQCKEHISSTCPNDHQLVLCQAYLVINR
jgi:hypothetical protein